MPEDTTSMDTREESTESTPEKVVLTGAKYSLMGQMIDDRYIVIDVIGEGDLTVVYMGQSADSRETVAIKTLKYGNPELIARFLEEVEKFKQIKHPAVVEIIEQFEGENKLPILVMEYIEGVTLKQLLESLNRIDEENTLLSILSGVCDALEYVHSKGMFHGGLNPNQILISENEVADDFTVKVSDFGTASLINEFELPESARAKASNYASFLSPEQKAQEYLAVNTDVFSLGAITYLMISGKNPMQSKKLSALVAGSSSDGPSFTPLTHLALDLPCLTELNQLMEQALEADPDWRMPSVSQFKKDLIDWHKKAIVEDFDDAEEFETGIDSAADFDAIDDTEFDVDDGAEIESAVEDPTIIQASESTSIPTNTERPGIRDEVTATGQSNVVSFKAEPSYYSELYKKESESTETTAEPHTDTNADADTSPDPNSEADKIILEEQVLKAAEEAPKKKKRRRRRSRSTQQNVRTTIRNLVSLRENQINQEETMAMQFAGKFSAKGPRRSPKDTAIRLGGACLVTAILTGLVMANLDTIQDVYHQTSLMLGSINSEEEEDEEIAIEPPSKTKAEEEKLKTKKIKKPILSLKVPLISSAKKRHKLNKLEKQTPLASDFYKNWRHSAYSKKTMNNSKVGNRRRIDYKEFDENWLK